VDDQVGEFVVPNGPSTSNLIKRIEVATRNHVRGVTLPKFICTETVANSYLEGLALGTPDCASDGKADDPTLGQTVGISVCFPEGLLVGSPVGLIEGPAVGFPEGLSEA